MVWRVLLIILIVLVIVLVVLYFLGRRMQKRQDAAQEQLDAMKQTTSMLIIDKKILPMKKSGLPQAAIDQTPWYLRRSKMPVVKARIGNRIMVLCADRPVWDVLPVKKEVKVELSGIYITAVKSVRGGKIQPPPKKKGLRARIRDRVSGSSPSASNSSSSSNRKKKKR